MPYRVLPETEDALTTAWVGDGSPIEGMKAIRAGYQNRLERDYTTEEPELLVVCNDPGMAEEKDAIDAIYGASSELPMETTELVDVTTSELRRALTEESDFLHYIGHVDADGFRCSDGWLDAADLDQVGASAFLLNSCTSYEQGQSLIEGGAIAGIVTILDVIDHQAARIGRTVASFLHQGFPLYAGLSVVREEYSLGASYVLLGNGQLTLTQPSTAPPEYLKPIEHTETQMTVTHQTFVNAENTGIGSFICPPYDGDRWYLLGGPIKTLDLTTDQVESLLERPMPLLKDKTLVESLETD